MSLLKKIIILVNLILCMLCINVFADDYPALPTPKHTYFHYILYEITGDYYYTYMGSNTYDFNVNAYIPTNVNNINFSTDKTVYKETRRYRPAYPSQGWSLLNSSNSWGPNAVNAITVIDFIEATFKIINQSDGSIFYSPEPEFDDSIVDWESAFEYYISSYEKDVSADKGFEYMDSKYCDSLFLYLRGIDLEGKLNPSYTMDNYNCFYNLCFDFDFIFTDSKGEEHIRTIFYNTPFDNNWNTIEMPYLVNDDSLSKEEQYNGFLMALELFTYPFTNEYENWEAWFNEQVEIYMDKYGYFDYDLVVKPYVTKMYTTDLTNQDIIYVYNEISLIYDIDNLNFVKPEDSPTKWYPIVDVNDIYYIVGPNGDIIDGIDNSDRYDFSDDWKIIDTWGENPPIQPVINETTGDLEMRDPDDNVINTLPIGENRPTADKLKENIELIGDYDLSRIFTGLKNELEELLEGNSLFNKFANMFQQIINWLPFSIKSLFFILISFYIIFEFIHILRK